MAHCQAYGLFDSSNSQISLRAILFFVPKITINEQVRRHVPYWKVIRKISRVNINSFFSKETKDHYNYKRRCHPYVMHGLQNRLASKPSCNIRIGCLALKSWRKLWSIGFWNTNQKGQVLRHSGCLKKIKLVKKIPLLRLSVKNIIKHRFTGVSKFELHCTTKSMVTRFPQNLRGANNLFSVKLVPSLRIYVLSLSCFSIGINLVWDKGPRA